MSIPLKTVLKKIINKTPNIKRKLIHLYDQYLTLYIYIFGNLIRIPAYFLNSIKSKIIAQPGTLSYKGGLFNPGALFLDENRILLLAKSQFLPWYKARGKNRKFYLAGDSIVILIDTNNTEAIKYEKINNLINFDSIEDFAIEDLRMFTWNQKKMINHSIILKEEKNGFVNQKSVKTALSELDEKNGTITFCNFPKADFILQDFEKNWVYKENDKQLLLFYSLNPYRVLELKNSENFEFKTIINQKLNDKVTNPGGFGTMVSFSTNPIVFDDEHWLIVIHQIDYKFYGRCYFHWAVLIDKSTFLPVKITSSPIFTGLGARGKAPGIRYITSILKNGNEVLFFAGEGDVYVTVSKKSVFELLALFELI